MSLIVGILKDRRHTLYLNHSGGGAGFIAVPWHPFWSKNDHPDPTCFDQPLLLSFFSHLQSIHYRK